VLFPLWGAVSLSMCIIGIKQGRNQRKKTWKKISPAQDWGLNKTTVSRAAACGLLQNGPIAFYDSYETKQMF